MSKREKILGLVASVMVTIVLELITSSFIEYDWEVRILTSLAWFCSILYFFADIYWIRRKKFVEYHWLSARMAICASILIFLGCLIFCGKSIEHRPIYVGLIFVTLFILVYCAHKLLNYKFE